MRCKKKKKKINEDLDLHCFFEPLTRKTFVPGMYRRSTDTRIHIRRSYENQNVALFRENASRTDTEIRGWNAFCTGSIHARTTFQEYHEAGNYKFYPQLPQGKPKGKAISKTKKNTIRGFAQRKNWVN